jgi:hypothetical protein
MAPEFCSFAFWSYISFLLPQYLGHQILGANINTAFAEHLYSNIHQPELTKSTT